VDWLTAGVECVKALAWPVVVSVIFLCCQAEIKKLIGRLRRAKHKDWELEFEEALKQVGEALPSPKREQVSEASKQVVEQLTLSPRDAIIDGWARVEAAVLNAAKRKDLNFSHIPPAARFWTAWTYLANKAAIPEYMPSVMPLLSMIRNRVFHDPDFEPPPGDVRQFLIYANALVDDLDRI
jgi:hypothetical protein